MLKAKDKVGKTPLEYVSVENWDCWNEFLNMNQERFWPVGGGGAGAGAGAGGASGNDGGCGHVNDDFVRNESLADPVNALSLHDAELVSSGQAVIE
jgi:hypothetical protein